MVSGAFQFSFFEGEMTKKLVPVVICAAIVSLALPWRAGAG
jgi:hypothetical protein